MVIPPPNVTGSLHLGHALMATIEDSITRYWRMKGKSCLWLPGTDHAGIATQAVVERRLLREGKNKHELGRENFLKEVWKWKNDYGGKICKQLRRMGCSVDWSREVFTMDERLSNAVTEAFVQMYEKGLIYRENRLCHWSCYLQSAISNAEVETIQLEKKTSLNVPGYKEGVEFGMLHKFKYPLEGSEKNFIEVATTRIETMLGDTAIAVHPQDSRYLQYHGKFAIHPFLKRKLPIVSDTFVDPAFGTGAVKITPAHDENDFECGKRHNLDFINILTEDGKINANGGPLFQNKLRYEARLLIIEELKKLNLYCGEQDNPMALQICSRSKDIIEPYLKPQWYVNCTHMAKKALDAVFVTKELKISPTVEGERLWQYFLGNIRPWCISRQLWWGHRIPAWHIVRQEKESKENKKDENKNSKFSELDMSDWIIARTEKEAYDILSKKLGDTTNVRLEQDPDVLDTWFSSGLFPFSTMGWPDTTTHDFRNFFPGTLLETGSDIIFFWVARMVMMSLELTGKLPFEQVLLHPMVRDKDGSKMSKSKGNVIDPLHIIDGVTLEVLLKELTNGNIKDSEVPLYVQKKKQDFPNGIPPCGADALRFGLLTYLTQHRNINLDVARIVGYRQFCNKIWNAIRFSLTKFDQSYQPLASLSDLVIPNDSDSDSSFFVQKWILSRLNRAITQCHISNPIYQFDQSTDAIYQFFIRDLCDVYLEFIKTIFRQSSKSDSLITLTTHILYICMDISLKLLHPFMPFVTEELWQRLPGSKSSRDSLIIQSYPVPISHWSNEKIEQDMELILNIIKNIRSDKQTSFHLPTKTAYPLAIRFTSSSPATSHASKVLQLHHSIIQTLAIVNQISIVDSSSNSSFADWPTTEHQIAFQQDSISYTCYHSIPSPQKK